MDRDLLALDQAMGLLVLEGRLDGERAQRYLEYAFRCEREGIVRKNWSDFFDGGGSR